MSYLNIEIKAKCSNQDEIRAILQSRNAEYCGIDHQIDTYFKVPVGRLKLREGNIENNLIYYQRDNQLDPKQSEYMLYKSDNAAALKEILIKAFGILVVVDKLREIYFIDNIKFHLDTVLHLGTFVEIEVMDKNRNIEKNKLLEQCDFYRELFSITNKNLIACSYSDLLLKKLDKQVQNENN